jgi:hypothetical protein
LTCEYKAFVERSKGVLFLSRGLFLNEINFQDDTISITFNFPADFTPPDRNFKIFVQQQVSNRIATYDKLVKLTAPTFNISNYIREPGVWHIKLEDQLAFRGQIRAETSELF